MKKIFKSFAIVGIGAIILTSCSDFLDQTSPSEMTGDAVFNSTTYTQQALNKVYAGLTKDETYVQSVPIHFGMNSDIELVDGLGATNSNSNNERGTCNYNPQLSWSKLNNNWKGMYEAIENANIVVEGIEGSALIAEGNASRSKMLMFKGEALTLRAMLYLDLIRTYGDVPMKFETTNTDGSNIYLGKTDRDVIMERLITDLEEAIGYLPWAGTSGYTTEKMTKGFAHGLLARIAMTYAGYSIRESSKSGYENMPDCDATYPTQRPGTEKRRELYTLAVKHLDAIIASGYHKLNPSYENEWYLLNQLTLDQTYQENLYEVAHGVSFSGEMGYTIGVRINGKTTYYGAKGNSSGKVKVTAPFFWSFNKNDQRRDLTFANFDIREGDNGNTIETMQGNSPFGIYLAKWDPRKMTDKWLNAARASADKVATGINNVIMRYSDVLLLYAEALNEVEGSYEIPSWNGETMYTITRSATALKEGIQPIRIRAGLPDYEVYDDVKKFRFKVKRERQIELFAEGHRFFDIRRWCDAPVEEALPIYGCNIYLTSENPDSFHTPIEVTSLPTMFTTKMWFWPIHHNIMKRNMWMIQNPGWKDPE